MRSYKHLALNIISLSSTAWGIAVPRAVPKHATHMTRTVALGLEIESFHPPSTYEVFGDGIDHPLSRRDDSSLEDSALSFVQSHLNVDSNSVALRSGFSSETAGHAYIKQIHNGIPIANAVANVAFNKDNKVVAFGSSFVKPKTTASTTPSISLTSAISKAEDTLAGTYNGIPTAIQYIYKEDGSLALTHSMQIRNETAGTWYDAFIDAHSGELVHITDFVANASYLVLPIHKQTLTEGFETLVDPFDPVSSPQGWHSTGGVSSTTTSGNNVMAFTGSSSAFTLTKQSSSNLNFIYQQDPTKAPSVQVNADAARTNAFYVANSVHDITYHYGFTEAAFNFQSNNWGKGGKGNDPVNISVQSTDGMDNANFATPPDGQSGLMKMFLWDYIQPERDGALENDIVTHEATHGVTNRLTGGGTAACLQTLESMGLGEGWSDTMANWVEKTSSAVPDYVLGPYVVNFYLGVRSHPYSTSTDVNPLKYSDLTWLREIHAIGEVWANILYNVYAALVAQYGWSATATTDATGTEGNVVFMHLFIDALPLQPCNPTFLNARDSWIQADSNRYKGANKCLLWKVFASRGMGINAADFGDSFALPAGC